MVRLTDVEHIEILEAKIRAMEYNVSLFTEKVNETFGGNPLLTQEAYADNMELLDFSSYKPAKTDTNE